MNNKINNTHYDIQSFTNEEESSSNDNIPPLATRHTKGNDNDSDNDDDNKEKTVPELYNQEHNPKAARDDDEDSEDDRECPGLSNKIDDDSDSDNDKEEKEDDDGTPKEPMNIRHGFLLGQNSIFIDTNEKGDYTDEDDNPIDSNIHPTNQQTKAKKYKRASKKKSKSSHHHPDY